MTNACVGRKTSIFLILLGSLYPSDPLGLMDSGIQRMSLSITFNRLFFLAVLEFPITEMPPSIIC